MPRPRKWRKVCALPRCKEFGPENEKPHGTIAMSIDEYEAIRLIDLEGLTQEKCAAQMDVARTTAQAIYASARKKIAQCIVEGLTLSIGGGEYRLCENQPHSCGRGNCHRQCQKEEALSNSKQDQEQDKNEDKNQEDNHMKIAVTYENEMVFQHFGKTEAFKVYSIEDGKVVSSEVLSTNGDGHGALAELLATWGVSKLICGGIGQGAQDALTAAGITFYGGTKGNTDELVEALLAGTLEYDANVKCDHHGHDHDHHHEHHHGHDSCSH